MSAPSNDEPQASSDAGRDQIDAASSDKTFEVDDLLKLARDKSQQGRSTLVAAIDDLYSGAERVLTKNDRAIMFDILRQLVHEVESSVRRRLAKRFSDRSDVPPDLIKALANDEINVAYPILVRSELLRDEELIEIIRHRTMEHHVAIAMRAEISEPVSDALVATGNEETIQTLLSNEAARISETNMSFLVEESSRITSYQQPLAFRRDLSPQLVRKLYLSVSDALQRHLAENFDIAPGEIGEVADAAVDEAMDIFADPALLQDTAAEHKGGEGTDLIELLRGGDVFEFLDQFDKLTKLRVALVRRFLFEPGGQGLAVICRALDLGKHHFATIFLRFRQGRLGDKQVDIDELGHAMAFFDKVAPETAKALLKRWRDDDELQNTNQPA